MRHTRAREVMPSICSGQVYHFFRTVRYVQFVFSVVATTSHSPRQHKPRVCLLATLNFRPCQRPCPPTTSASSTSCRLRAMLPDFKEAKITCTFVCHVVALLSQMIHVSFGCSCPRGMKHVHALRPRTSATRGTSSLSSQPFESRRASLTASCVSLLSVVQYECQRGDQGMSTVPQCSTCFPPDVPWPRRMSSQYAFLRALQKLKLEENRVDATGLKELRATLTENGQVC